LRSHFFFFLQMFWYSANTSHWKTYTPVLKYFFKKRLDDFLDTKYLSFNTSITYTFSNILIFCTKIWIFNVWILFIWNMSKKLWIFFYFFFFTTDEVCHEMHFSPLLIYLFCIIHLTSLFKFLNFTSKQKQTKKTGSMILFFTFQLMTLFVKIMHFLENFQNRISSLLNCTG